MPTRVLTWLPHPSRAVCERVGTLTFDLDPTPHRGARRAPAKDAGTRRATEAFESHSSRLSGQTAASAGLSGRQLRPSGSREVKIKVKFESARSRTLHRTHGARSARTVQDKVKTHVLFFKPGAAPSCASGSGTRALRLSRCPRPCSARVPPPPAHAGTAPQGRSKKSLRSRARRAVSPRDATRQPTPHSGGQPPSPLPAAPPFRNLRPKKPTPPTPTTRATSKPRALPEPAGACRPRPRGGSRTNPRTPLQFGHHEETK